VAEQDAIKPREAVLRMAPYSPPTGQRIGKLRMDFNENTVGCSPRIAQFLRDKITEALVSVYPDYSGVREALAPHFGVEPSQILLTNGGSSRRDHPRTRLRAAQLRVSADAVDGRDRPSHQSRPDRESQ
jgi:hypothetical protein